MHQPAESLDDRPAAEPRGNFLAPFYLLVSAGGQLGIVTAGSYVAVRGATGDIRAARGLRIGLQAREDIRDIQERVESDVENRPAYADLALIRFRRALRDKPFFFGFIGDFLRRRVVRQDGPGVFVGVLNQLGAFLVA